MPVVLVIVCVVIKCHKKKSSPSVSLTRLRDIGSVYERPNTPEARTQPVYDNLHSRPQAVPQVFYGGEPPPVYSEIMDGATAKSSMQLNTTSGSYGFNATAPPETGYPTYVGASVMMQINNPMFQGQEASGGHTRHENGPNPCKVPLEFLCPISGSIMRDPVVAADGYTYEREAFEQHLCGSLRSPVTSELMSSREINPNYALRKKIREFSRNNNGVIQGNGSRPTTPMTDVSS